MRKFKIPKPESTTNKTIRFPNSVIDAVEGTWDTVHAQAKDLDDLINAFNEATGLLKDL